MGVCGKSFDELKSFLSGNATIIQKALALCNELRFEHSSFFSCPHLLAGFLFTVKVLPALQIL